MTSLNIAVTSYLKFSTSKLSFFYDGKKKAQEENDYLEPSAKPLTASRVSSPSSPALPRPATSGPKPKKNSSGVKCVTCLGITLVLLALASVAAVAFLLVKMGGQ